MPNGTEKCLMHVRGECDQPAVVEIAVFEVPLSDARPAESFARPNPWCLRHAVFFLTGMIEPPVGGTDAPLSFDEIRVRVIGTGR